MIKPDLKLCDLNDEERDNLINELNEIGFEIYEIELRLTELHRDTALDGVQRLIGKVEELDNLLAEERFEYE